MCRKREFFISNANIFVDNVVLNHDFDLRNIFQNILLVDFWRNNS